MKVRIPRPQAMQRSLLLVVALALLVAQAAACASGVDQDTTPAGDSGGVLEMSLTATEWAYLPSQVSMPVGQRVHLALTNEGVLAHDIKIDAPAEDVDVIGGSEEPGHGAHAEPLHIYVAPGHSGSIAFTPAQPGTYQFYCTVPGHKEAGMTGSLVVTAG